MKIVVKKGVALTGTPTTSAAGAEVGVKRSEPLRGGGGRFLVTLLLMLLSLGAGFAGGYYYEFRRIFKQSEYLVRVVDIMDGDTVEVEWFGGVSKLRIVGIDTFENKDNKKLHEQAQTWKLSNDDALKIAKRAEEVTRQKLLNRMITIRFPAEHIERDAFGRLLAYVFVDGNDHGKYLLSEGLAYPRPESHVREKYYEWPTIQAKNDKKGIYVGQ